MPLESSGLDIEVGCSLSKDVVLLSTRWDRSACLGLLFGGPLDVADVGLGLLIEILGLDLRGDLAILILLIVDLEVLLTSCCVGSRCVARYEGRRVSAHLLEEVVLGLSRRDRWCELLAGHKLGRHLAHGHLFLLFELCLLKAADADDTAPEELGILLVRERELAQVVGALAIFLSI